MSEKQNSLNERLSVCDLTGVRTIVTDDLPKLVEQLEWILDSKET